MCWMTRRAISGRSYRHDCLRVDIGCGEGGEEAGGRGGEGVSEVSDAMDNGQPRVAGWGRGGIWRSRAAVVGCLA